MRVSLVLVIALVRSSLQLDGKSQVHIHIAGLLPLRLWQIAVQLQHCQTCVSRYTFPRRDDLSMWCRSHTLTMVSFRFSTFNFYQSQFSSCWVSQTRWPKQAHGMVPYLKEHGCDVSPTQFGVPSYLAVNFALAYLPFQEHLSFFPEHGVFF